MESFLLKMKSSSIVYRSIFLATTLFTEIYTENDGKNYVRYTDIYVNDGAGRFSSHLAFYPKCG